MKLSTKALRPLLTLSASVFALVTLFLMANKGFGKISMAALTLLFVWAPFVLEKLLKKTLPLPLYLFCLSMPWGRCWANAIFSIIPFLIGINCFIFRAVLSSPCWDIWP